jgi:hypothetical protein
MTRDEHPSEYALRTLANRLSDLSNAALNRARSGEQASYEAAMAYSIATHEVRDTADKLARQLDALHAEETAGGTWPIPQLENMTSLFPDYPTSNDRDQRYARWGVEGDIGSGKTAVVRVGRSSFDRDVILGVAVGADTEQPAEQELSVRLTQDQWMALSLLVDRIGRGYPTPYDEHGNTHPEALRG